MTRPSRGHFSVIHISSGLKTDLYPSQNHPLFGWALSHRRKVRIREQDVWPLPPEYVILWKLEIFREGSGEKSLRDIRRILPVSREGLDLELVSGWAKNLGLIEALSECIGQSLARDFCRLRGKGIGCFVERMADAIQVLLAVEGGEAERVPFPVRVSEVGILWIEAVQPMAIGRSQAQHGERIVAAVLGGECLELAGDGFSSWHQARAGRELIRPED